MPGKTCSKCRIALPNDSAEELCATCRAGEGQPPNAGPTIKLEIPAEPPKPTIKGYQLIREISRGGQAVVYEAIQLSTTRRAAVKVLQGGAFIGPKERARFEREVMILATLNHPNIVQVIDRGTTADGSSFLVMPYISGLSLDKWLELYYQKHPAGPPPEDPSELLRLFLGICDAVNAAHLRGVVHRDLKPSNIRIDESNQPHILDFGLAHTSLPTMTDEEQPQPVTLTGQFLGSLPWASPEQAAGEVSKIDTRTDVYSLGVILYEMLTGKFPYEVAGNMLDVLRNILHTKPTPPSEVVLAKDVRGAEQRKRWLQVHKRAINATMDAIILKALSKHRADRYQAAGALANDLTNYLAGRPTVAVAESPKEPEPVISRAKRRFAIAMGCLMVTGLAVAVVMMLYQQRSVRSKRSLSTGLSKNSYRTNSLGMVFVPVPGTKVWFSIWDTRVRDYKTFVAATHQFWPSPDFEQGDDHPAVMVSWKDAEAFCRWLTEQEIRTGRLDAAYRYRLPTDSEWSLAAGLGTEEGVTPADKNGKLPGFPWGEGWPPPAGAGNFAGQEAAGPSWPTNRAAPMRGYRDDYPRTSPVGAFPANRFGLYDMSGNVWQWCEDWYDDGRKYRVLRGGGWDCSQDWGLKTSMRHREGDSVHYFNLGFRCVLDPGIPSGDAGAAPARAGEDVPIIEFVETNKYYVELEQGYSLTARRTGPTNEMASVRNRSLDEPTNFSHIDNLLTFRAGEQTVDTGNVIPDDLVTNADRVIHFELSEPSDGYQLVNSQVTITILDNDRASTPGIGVSGGIKDAVFDADGNIIVCGGFNYASGFKRTCIAKLDPDGRTVEKFDTRSGPDYWLGCAAPYPDGRIFIGGAFRKFGDVRRTRIARLKATGSLDLDFKSTTGADDWVYCAVIQPDEKILMGGEFSSVNGIPCARIARLNTDGNVDASFKASAAPHRVSVIALQPDGKILVGGDFTQVDGVEATGLARLNRDGTLDPGFELNEGSFALVHAVQVLEDGRIMIGGDFTSYQGVERSAVARLLPNGRLDETFKVENANFAANSIALQPDGKIIVASRQGLRSSVCRFEKNGARDPSFHQGFSQINLVQSVLVLTNNRIFVAGEFKYYDGVYAPGFVILEPDGRLPARKADWVEWPKAGGGNGHYYALTEHSASWQEAEIEAQQIGAHLVEIRGAKEQEFLEHAFLHGEIMLRPLWIGLRRTQASAPFEWSDGSSISYANWSKKKWITQGTAILFA